MQIACQVLFLFLKTWKIKASARNCNCGHSDWRRYQKGRSGFIENPFTSEPNPSKYLCKRAEIFPVSCRKSSFSREAQAIMIAVTPHRRTFSRQSNQGCANEARTQCTLQGAEAVGTSPEERSSKHAMATFSSDPPGRLAESWAIDFFFTGSNRARTEKMEPIADRVLHPI